MREDVPKTIPIFDLYKVDSHNQLGSFGHEKQRSNPDVTVACNLAFILVSGLLATGTLQKHREAAQVRKVYLFFVIFTMLLLLYTSQQSRAQGGTTLGNIAASMQPGTWAQVAQTNINAILGVGPSTGNKLPFASSAAWDSSRLKLHYVGNDHGEPSSYIVYDATTNSWTNTGTIPVHSGHGYDHLSLNPNSGSLYVREYGISPGGNTIWELPMGGSWAVKTQWPNTAYINVANGTAWWTGTFSGAGAQGTLFVYNCGAIDGQVVGWNPLTNTWIADIKGFGGNSTYHCVMEYSPVYNVAVFGGGNDNLRSVWRLNQNRTVTALATSPVDLGIQEANIVADPVTGNILVLGFGQFWELDPRGSGTWRRLSTPPSSVGDPAWGVLDGVISAPISNYGVVAYITCRISDCNFYLYKHGSGTLPPASTSDSIAPSAPTNVSATVSSNQINVSWAASTDNVGVAGYRIYRCQGTGCTATVQVATSQSTTYADVGLLANTTYIYRITAYDAAGNASPQSDPASATTSGTSLPALSTRLAVLGSNHHYLQNASGKPMFLLGFGNEDKSTPGVLDQLQGKINYLRAYAALWLRTEDANNYIGGRPHPTVAGKMDMDQWNETYWSNLKDYLGNANARGITVGLTIWDGHSRLPGGKFDTDSVWNSQYNVQSVQWAYDYNALVNFPNPQPAGGTSDRLVYYQRRWVDRLITEISGYPNVLIELNNEDSAGTENWWLWWAQYFKGKGLVVAVNEGGGSGYISDSTFAATPLVDMKSYHDRDAASITT